MKKNKFGELFLGFETADDIFKTAQNIGDVRTESGKRRAMLFLTKCACTLDTRDERGYDYSFETTLANGLQGKFSGKFSDEVRYTIKEAYEVFKETSNPPTEDYYFKDGKLQKGLDSADCIIGNSLHNLMNTLYYGYPKSLFKEMYAMDICGYEDSDVTTEEDVLVLELSCRKYTNDKKNKQKVLKK